MRARHLITWGGSALLAAALAGACQDSSDPDSRRGSLSAGAAPASSPTESAIDAAAMAGHHHVIVNGERIKWGPAPPVFPAGAELAVLQGDPSVAGAIFTIRLRLPDRYLLPPHWHPTDEHVTVLRGTFLVGLGDEVSRQAFLPPLKPGDFITAPALAHHFARARGRTVVQVHAIGPFAMTYVHPEDDPRNR